jgi:hypothetical protein
MQKSVIQKYLVGSIMLVFLIATIIPSALGVNQTTTQRTNQRPAGYEISYLLIPDSTADTVGKYDANDGTYLGDIINGVGRFSTPVNAIIGPDGNIYVSDQLADSVFVYDTSGTYLFTYADASDGLDNIRGIDFRGTHLFVTSGNDYVAEFSGPHTRLPDFINDGTDPFDILFLSDGRSLLSDIQGTTDNIRLYDESGVLLQILFQINFPEQVQTDSVLPGEYLTAGFSANVIDDFELTGTIVQTTPYSGGRGVYRLGNGNLLATSAAGVQEIQSGTGTILQTEKTGSCHMIELSEPPGNLPPYEPNTPNPTHEATNVPLNSVLSWIGGDPNPDDTVTYDVYFDTVFPPTKKASNQTATTYTPSVLAPITKYYWKIVAWDNLGASTVGPIWDFTTKTNTPPNNPTITGPAEGKIKVPIAYNFTTTDSEGDDIYFFIDWGDTTNSSWIGPYPSGDLITESHSWSKKGTYSIKAKAKDIYGAESSWGSLTVTMPCSYNIPVMQFCVRLFERFPHAFPLLQHILDY